jgi:hypothetical protein
MKNHVLRTKEHDTQELSIPKKKTKEMNHSTFQLYAARAGCAAILALGLFTGRTEGAPLVSGSASVNGTDIGNKEVDNVNAKALKVTGLTIAGAYVNNGSQLGQGNQPISSYNISTEMVGAKANAPMKAADAEQTKVLKNVMEEVQTLGLAVANGNKKKIEGASADVVKSLKATEDFPSIPKAPFGAKEGSHMGATAKARNKIGDAGTETAEATGSQTLKQFNPPGNPTTTSSAKSTSTITPQALKGALASSFVINNDPITVQWGGAPAAMQVNLDGPAGNSTSPASLSLSAAASGGATSVSLFDLGASYVNFSNPASVPSDTDTLADAAKPLYNLEILLSNNGSGPKDVFDLTVAPGATIVDNLGDSGTKSVLADMMASTQLVGDTLSFDDNFSFEVSVPDATDTSVLFTDEIAATEVRSAPDAPSFATPVLAALGLLGCRRRWLGRAG